VPIALAGGGAFPTCALTRHATTNMNVIGQFLGVRFTVSPEPDGAVVVE
jgi:RNA 3'-terminal phosphate cyclase